MQDLTPNKSLGQHWLYDEEALKSICQAADIQLGDTVLEIGPGLGTLTKKLVERAGKVIAIEIDQRLANELPNQLVSDKLTVIQQDILKFNFSTLSEDFKVVANIPYYLTSNLIRVLSETTNPPKTAVVLIQKEVAERVASKPGQMSLLSVTAQMYWQVSLDRVVKAELFTPPPKVDSQVLILKRRSQPIYEDVYNKQFFRLVKAGFSQKRKTLLNSLSAGLHIPKEQVEQLLSRANISLLTRPQALSIDDWYRLSNANQD